MRKYIEKIDQMTLPVIALRGIVAFPGVTLNVELADPLCIKAAEAAFETDTPVLLCTAKLLDIEEISEHTLYGVGTVAKIKQTIKTPEGNMRIIAEGFSRASVTEFRTFADYLCADVIAKVLSMSDEDTARSEAYHRAIMTEVENLVKLLPSVSDDVLSTARSIESPALLADFIASNILVRYPDKQDILSCFDPVKRIERLIALLREEATILEYELDIHKKVRQNINRNQKEYYLREQINVIKEELGEGAVSEIAEYEKRILDAKLPKEVEEKLFKELDRLEKTPFGAAESAVLRTYLDTCLDLPWNTSTRDRVNVEAAKKILDRDHDGLEKVKERILEFLAVKQLNPNVKNQILCLVGPPGVGKTSVAASIAEAMKRKYVRVSLGGIRDEADIRGHRKTYVGAMPGRILQALITAKVQNPLILLDEIDKMTRDAHGDPSSALLEVLDGEQNKSFRDHFVELPFDLSNCLFIATANTLDTVPRPLLDRMEVVELRTYTRQEKLSIAKNHLIPKQLKRHGITRRMLKLRDEAILAVIDGYTKEAGVRNLERAICRILRRAAGRFVADPTLRSLTVSAENLSEYLGNPKVLPERLSDSDEIGVVNGLAYTEAGGDLLRVEALVLDGEGKLELTGSLGDVMKESGKIASSYVRSVSRRYGIPSDFYKKHDLHVHFPEGAVPKDGPSAGVTMVTAIISALSGFPVRRDLAMTGEISLRGKVLPIGGLREKTMAAMAAGIHTVLLPKDNMKDLDELDPLVKSALHFVPCDTLEQVLTESLVIPKETSLSLTAPKAEESREEFEGLLHTARPHTPSIPLSR